MIGPGITIKGEVTGDEDLVIKGTVEGLVNLFANEVTIGESGKVKADIKGRMVTVNGEVTGDIGGSEKVIVSRSGHVRGNIVAPRVTLEDGAVFKGSIDMDPGESVRKPVPVPSAQTKQTATGDGLTLDIKKG